MLEDFQNQIKNRAGHFLLAVSGGLDSMTLWQMFRATKLNHAVAHVNFGLRGAESDADQALVETIAAEHGIKVFIKKVDTKSFAKEHKLGTQEAARSLRYTWFEELKKEYDYDQLVTAHHLNDSVETFMINLHRGTGLKGLGGIRSTEKVLRPLLDFSKAELHDYASKNKIEFRNDASNAKDDYLRNWFRNGLLKEWKEKNPELLTRMKSNLENLRQADEMLDYFLEKEAADLKISKQSQIPFQILIPSLTKSKYPAAHLFRILEDFGFNYSQVNDLLAAIHSKHTGAQIKSKTHMVLLNRDLLIVDKIKDEPSNESLWIEKNVSSIDSPLKLQFYWLTKAEVDFTSNSFFLDADQLTFPLELRKWKEGDSMIPLGMKGQKKISDILIDEKVPLHQKDQCFVLLSNQKIVCLLNFRISEEFKIQANTKSILKIQ